MPRQSGESGRQGQPIKKKQRGGPELLYAAGIILVLGVTALIIGITKNGERAKNEEIKNAAEKVFHENMDLGKKAFQIANTGGLLFVMGKEEGIPDKKEALPQKLDEKLFGLLRSDPKVYNAIYERNYKDKRNKEQTDQRALYPDKLSMFTMPDVGETDHDVKLMYGFAENKAVPVVIASKNINPEPNDAANLGGQITIIVKAANEARFERALKPRAPAEGEKENGAIPPPAAPAAPAAK